MKAKITERDGSAAELLNTPLSHLQIALRDSDLAKRQLARVFQDPSAEIHGNLIVALGALRRAAESVKQLIRIEETQLFTGANGGPSLSRSGRTPKKGIARGAA